MAIVYSFVTMAEFPSQPAAVSAASAGSSHFPQRPAADADPFFNGSAPFRHYSTLPPSNSRILPFPSAALLPKV